MVQMLLAEGMLLCSLFWAFCWLGTGSDEKNIRNFSTYPDEVQKIVKARPELSGNIRQRGPAAIFAGNLLLFTALLFAMGLLTRQEYFAGNCLNTLLLGQALNLFDFFGDRPALVAAHKTGAVFRHRGKSGIICGPPQTLLRFPAGSSSVFGCCFNQRVSAHLDLKGGVP